MTIAVKVQVKGADKLQRLTKRLQTVAPVEIANSLHELSKIMANSLRAGALNDPLRSPPTTARTEAAFKIRAKRLSRFRSVVVMPGSLIDLDGMSAHYVALKPGRKISKWANKYYTGKLVGGRSRVYRGPRKGIIYKQGKKSALYVTPHRFIEKSLRKENKKLPTNLKRIARKAITISRG